MKTLSIEKLEQINGGLADKDSFCKGFGAVALAYEAGVLLNAWNPVGWGGAAAMVAVGVYCAV